MLVNDTPYTSIWHCANTHAVYIIDQTRLPHRFRTLALKSLADCCHAIQSMQVRGAPLIGATAAFGLAFALLENGSDDSASNARQALLETRPTAVNLHWAVNRVWQRVTSLPASERGIEALSEANRILAEDISICEKIGEQGLQLIQQRAQERTGGGPLNILTHCNAGWLATVNWGTALAPIYKAQAADIDIHVWVDETRPRNQGASLTAWELRHQGIAHTVIPDNAAGHVMQRGLVDLCIVGSDRTSANGDVCNKIGTYSKALAAADNDIPFYAALPVSTIDWSIADGVSDIPIEQRSAREVTHISGVDEAGNVREVQLLNGSPVANYAFDVTPASLVTNIITEYGIYQPQNLSTLKAALEGNQQ